MTRQLRKLELRARQPLERRCQRRGGGPFGVGSRLARAARAHLTLALLVLVGCSKQDEAGAAGKVEGAAPAASNAAIPKAALQAGEASHIPVGAFRAGSLPGDSGRRPEIEPRETSVQLGPFRIDRLPYPNDPASPPRLGMSRDAALRACAERGGRLCTELEWERACKGPETSTYSTGPEWNASCEKDWTSCQNGFDVLGLGTLLEWTSSDVVPPKGETKPTGPVVRGAPAGIPGPERRCARRATQDEVDDKGIGFRCCYGAPNGAKVAEPVIGKPYEKVVWDAKRLSELLAKDPRTAELAKDVTLFREPEAAETVVARGPGDRKGFLFTVHPLVWNPARGARFLVLTGRSGPNTSFVLAYHVVSDAEHRLAASFVMKNEVGPVALAYSDSIRPRLHFSTCWGCPGETGKLLFRPPETVAILQP